MSPNRPRTHDAKLEEVAKKRHERLVEQWRNIRRLYLAGADLRDICCRLRIGARTVYRYKDLEEPPPRPTYKRKSSVLYPTCPTSSNTGTRGAAQRQASVQGTPGAGLRQQRGDLRPPHRPAPPRRSPGKTAIVRAPREEGLCDGSVSHL
jgi:hypothetical protein